MKKRKSFVASLFVCFTLFGVNACTLPFSSSESLQSGSESRESADSSQEQEVEGLAFKIEENNAQVIFAYDGTTEHGEYVTNGAESELSSFQGDYTGNAVKMPYVAGEQTYRFVHSFTAQEIDTMQNEYGFTHVSFWFAVDGIQSGSIAIFNSLSMTAYSVLYAAGYEEYPFTVWDNKCWYNVLIPIATYKNTVFYDPSGSGKQYVHLMSLQGEEIADIDVEDGNATDDISLYVGNVEFVRDSAFLSVNAFTADGIWNKDVKSTYISPNDETLMTFSGGYVGGAKRFRASANVGYRIDNLYTLEQLKALQKYYTHLTFFFAFDKIETGKISIDVWSTDSKYPKVLEYAKINHADGVFTPDDNGVWHSMSITLADFITLCTAEDGKTAIDCFYLFRVINKATAIEPTEPHFYVGDIFFENLN